jgi:NitT/TauT family transport system substrate-binding protein
MRPGSAAVACLAAVLLAAACGSGPQASPGTSGSTPKTGSAALEKTHIVFGASPVADDAAIFLAIKDGYFRQQGLTVTPELAVQSTQQVPDLLHGTLDIIGGNYVSFFEGDAQQTFDLKVLAETSSCVPKSFEILTLPRSGIKGAAGLAGKTIAVNLTHSIQTLTTNRLLQADGVNPGSVHYVVIPFTEMAAALKAGRVDAISVVEPFVTAAEHSVGAVPAMSQCQGPTASLPLAGYFTTQSWLQRYPNTARAFQRAIEKAQQLANTDHQAVVQILPTYTKLTPQTAALITLDTYPDTLNAAQLQRVADLMYSGGLLKSPLNVSTLLFH